MRTIDTFFTVACLILLSHICVHSEEIQKHVSIEFENGLRGYEDSSDVSFKGDQGSGSDIIYESGSSSDGDDIQPDQPVETPTFEYAEEIEGDTEKTISDVVEWITQAAGHDDTRELRTAFTLNHTGEWSTMEPCGSLVAHNLFGLLKPFVENPKKAKLKKKMVKKEMWQPSKKCLNQKYSVEVDGGSEVYFTATCGNQTLLSASSAMGSVTRLHLWKNSEVSGAMAYADFFEGEMESFGAVGLLGKHAHKVSGTIPEHLKNANEILNNFTTSMSECAANGNLVVQGRVSGGWIQKYSHSILREIFEGPDKKAVFGYSNVFEITYGNKSGEKASPTSQMPPVTPPLPSPVGDILPSPNAQPPQPPPIGDKPQPPDTQSPQLPDAQSPQLPGAQSPQPPDTKSPQLPDAQSPQLPGAQSPQPPDAQSSQPPDEQSPQSTPSSVVTPETAAPSTNQTDESGSYTPTITFSSSTLEIVEHGAPDLMPLSKFITSQYLEAGEEYLSAPSPSSFIMISLNKLNEEPTALHQLQTGTSSVNSNSTSIFLISIGFCAIVFAAIAFVVYKAHSRRQGYTLIHS